MDNYEEILEELREEYDKCNDLFNIAYELNSNENTRTAFSQKVTSYMSEVMQTLGFLIGEFERENIQEQTLEDAVQIEADYDVKFPVDVNKEVEKYKKTLDFMNKLCI